MKLLLISLDEEYVNIIEGAMAGGLSGKVDISIISDMKFLSEFANYDYKVNLLIVDEKCVEYTGKIKADTRLIITERNDNTEGFIYKYGGGQAVLRSIPIEYIRSDGLNDSKLIKVTGITGGSGKTTTAIGVAKVLYEMGRKVLYINSENIQNFSYLIDEEKTLPDEVIRVLTKPATVSADYILRAVEKNGFDYVPEMRGVLSSWQITVDIMLDIAGEICKRKIYDYVIFEMPDEVTTKDAFRIHPGENAIVTLLQDKYSVKKTERFIEAMGYTPESCFLVCGKYRADEEDALGETVENCTVCEKVAYDTTGQYKDCFVRTATAVS